MGIVKREKFITVGAQDFNLKEVATEHTAIRYIRVNSRLMRNDGPDRKLRKDPHVDESLIVPLNERDVWIEISEVLPVELPEDFNMFDFLHGQDIGIDDLCNSPGYLLCIR